MTENNSLVGPPVGGFSYATHARCVRLELGAWRRIVSTILPCKYILIGYKPPDDVPRQCPARAPSDGGALYLSRGTNGKIGTVQLG